MKNALLRALPALAWAGLLFWLSSQPELPRAVFLFEGIDKVFHAGAYGVLALLVLVGLPRGLRHPALVALALSSLYGVTDELHQLFVPGRTCDVRDWLADTAGAALVLVALRLWQRARLARPTPSS